MSSDKEPTSPCGRVGELESEEERAWLESLCQQHRLHSPGDLLRVWLESLGQQHRLHSPGRRCPWSSISWTKNLRTARFALRSRFRHGGRGVLCKHQCDGEWWLKKKRSLLTQYGGTQGWWRRVAYGREESKPLRGRVFKKQFPWILMISETIFFIVYFGTTFTFTHQWKGKLCQRF